MEDTSSKDSKSLNFIGRLNTYAGPPWPLFIWLFLVTIFLLVFSGVLVYSLFIKITVPQIFLLLLLLIMFIPIYGMFKMRSWGLYLYTVLAIVVFLADRFFATISMGSFFPLIGVFIGFCYWTKMK